MTHTPLTTQQLAEITTRLNAATPGPWTIAKVPPYTDPLLMSQYDETPADGNVLIAGSIDVGPADAAFIAAARTAVPALLADNQHLRTRLATVRADLLLELASLQEATAATDVIRRRRSIATARRLFAVELRGLADDEPAARPVAASEDTNR